MSEQASGHAVVSSEGDIGPQNRPSDDPQVTAGQTPVGDDQAATEATPQAPVTGNNQVDELLRGLVDVDQAPLPERARRLGAAQEQLQAILNSSRDGGIPMPAPHPD